MSVMQRLKGETADLHAQVEAKVLLQTEDDYRRYLSIMADMHDAYDVLFEKLPRDLVGKRLGRGAKARSDCLRIGGTLRPTPPKPPALDLSESLGALYVLEGSTLGGRVLLKELRKLHGDDIPTSYLEGYGSATSAMWKALASALDTHDAAHHDGDRIVAGAAKCFAQHLEVFSR